MSNPTEYVASLSDDKCDPKLGAAVQKHLQELGLVHPSEFPIDASHGHPRYHPENAVGHIQQGIALGLLNLGLDIHGDPSLKDTPKRYAKMVVGELTKGLNFDFFPKMTVTPNGTPYYDDISKDQPPQVRGKYDQMVLVKRSRVISLCEHHLQTIDGYAHVAYIPNEKVCGLSKLSRVVEFFSRRPQIQERLTEQVYHALQFCLGTEDIAVVVEAAHYCMKARGAMQQDASTTTDKMGGKFMTNPALREEFFDRVNA
jgi:GTP cyclohydrolase I